MPNWGRGDIEMNLFIQKIKNSASKVSGKTHKIMEMKRVQARIVEKRREWKQNVYKIGKLVYDAYKKNDLTLAEEGLKEIAQLNLLVEEELKLLDWKVSELHKQKRCECGEVAPFTANFCSVCGRKLPEPPQGIVDKLDELGQTFLKMKQEGLEEAAVACDAELYSTPSEYSEHGSVRDDGLNVTVGGRRITIVKEEEFHNRRCLNCNSTAAEHVKWCVRCGKPFM